MGILKAYNVKVEIEAPEGMEFEISPEKVNIERRSVQSFSITLNILKSGDYILKIRTAGNFAQDTIYIKIHVE